MYSKLVNAFSATRAGSWLVRNFATKIDPILFRASGGRFTSTGIPTLPMLTLSAVGRKSGELRHVQLAFYQDGEDYLVVASAMGQDRHPGWRYNIEADPAVELQVRGERFPANARVLDEDEKARLWPEIKKAIPQMDTYETRTERNILVFRLSRRTAKEIPAGQGTPRHEAASTP